MLMKYFLYDPRKGGKYNVYGMVWLTFTHKSNLPFTKSITINNGLIILGWSPS